MASSGSITKAIRTGYTLRVDWTENSQSVANNKSNITVAAKLISGGSSYTINSTASKNISLTINGTTYNGTCSVGLTGNQTKTLFSKTVDVAHNTNGSKTCAISCTLGLNVTLSGTYYGDQTASGNAILDVINRVSVLGTISNFTFGNTITIPITKYVSTFTDSLVIKIGTTTIKTISPITNGASVSFTSTELANAYAALPSSTSGTITFVLTTKNGTTTIGTSTKTANGAIPTTIKPTISNVSLVEATSGLATQFGAYVQNKSKINGTITVSNEDTGSSIESYQIAINGVTYASRTFTTGILKFAGTGSSTITQNRAVVTVTDKRGRTATSTTNFNVMAYTEPTISNFSVVRCNVDGTENASGTYAKVNLVASVTPITVSGTNKNTKTFNLQYKLKSASTWTTNITYTTNYNWTLTNRIISGISADSSYDFRVNAIDYFGTSTKSLSLSTGAVVLDILEDGTSVAIGKVAETSNTFDIKQEYKTFISNNAYMGGQERSDNEKNIYFTNTGNGTNSHNAKLYGGNGESTTTLGAWDSARSQAIWQYFTGTSTFTFGGNINVVQNGRPVIVDRAFSYGANSGNMRFSNGWAIQWGKTNVTPTTANTNYNVSIYYPTVFTTKPNVFIMPQSSAPNAQEFSIGQSTAGLDYFSIYINKTSASATSFHWVAIGRIV